jgi:hypothetical protein
MVGGQKRIRTCSLLEDGYVGLFGPSNTKADDTDEDLNIDGDDTIQFGQAQYPILRVKLFLCFQY